MKKKLVKASLIALSGLFLNIVQPLSVFAEARDQNVGIGFQVEEQKSLLPKTGGEQEQEEQEELSENKEEQSKRLPQTGEIIQQSFAIFGVMIIAISIILIRKKQKTKKR